MKFEIKNRWTGEVQFTADIDCNEDTQFGIKVGLAVKWGVKNGAVLNGADLSGAVLSGADLSGADLRRADLNGAVLNGAVLNGADLSGADLSGADLSGADLNGAVLNGADLRRAVLSGVPRIKDIHQTIYAAASKDGALDMGDWHTCDTTHCRAGWVTHLAGEGGAALEWVMGTPAAAAIIYLASDPDLERVPDFYCDDATALADMKRLAGLEASKTDPTR